MKVGYRGKDLQKRKVLSLEWKSEGVMDDETGEFRAYSKEFFGVHSFKSSCVMYCTNSIQSNNKLEQTS